MVVVDGGGGGWWWMVEKNVLGFRSNFFQMKFRLYECAEIWKIREKLFFIGKKSNFNFQKVGVFWSKKRFSDFSQNFVRRSLGDINVPPFRFF